MFFWLLSIIVLLFAAAAADYYLVYYNTNYFNKRGIPTAPIPHKFWNHLHLFIDRKIPFYLAYDQWTKNLGNVCGFFLGSRRVLMVGDLSMAVDVTIKQFENFSERMIIPSERLDKYLGRKNIMSAKGNAHRRMRALMSQCLTPASVKKITPKVDDAARSFVQILEDKIRAGDTEGDGSIVVQRHCLEYIMDILCRLTLGTEECLQFKNPYTKKVEELMASYSRTPVQKYAYFWTVTSNLWLPFFEAYNHFFKDRRMQLFTDLSVVVGKRKVIRDEMASRGEAFKQKDFVDMMMDAEDPSVTASNDFKKKLSPSEVISNCVVLIAGGLESTSNSAVICLYYLAKYPHYQAMLKEEIDDYFDVQNDEKQDSIVFEKLKEVKLLDAFIKEALRINPPVPQGVIRRALRTTTVGKDNFEVERGMYVFINERQLQKDPAIWGPDTDEFRPERFFELTPEQNLAYLAFGDGPRKCPGVLVAMNALKLMFVRLLQRFKVEPTDRIDEQFEDFGPTTTTTVRINQLNLKFVKL